MRDVVIGTATFAHRGDLPHLVNEGKNYSVTFCTKKRAILSPESRDIVLAACVHDHERRYWLTCAMVRPDHVHLILRPYEGHPLASILDAIKGASAHRINRCLGRKGPVWQRESFDHILRSDESLADKAEYVSQTTRFARDWLTILASGRWFWSSI